EHVHDLLMQRQARQSRHRTEREKREQESGGVSSLPEPLHRTLKEQRQLLNSLVGVYANQTGDPHGTVHAWLRRTCGGPAVAQARAAISSFGAPKASDRPQSRRVHSLSPLPDEREFQETSSDYRRPRPVRRYPQDAAALGSVPRRRARRGRDVP